MAQLHRIYPRDADRESLSHLKTVPVNSRSEADYTAVVVNKPWGYEYLTYQNLHVAAWVLHIQQNLGTSLHCHIKKKTALLVLSGSVVTSTLDTRYELTQMDAVVIEPCVFHATRAVSQEGAFVM